MERCEWCQKPIDSERSTKRFCSTTCRVKAWGVKRADKGITVEETLDVLNYYYFNEPERIKNPDLLDMLNMLFVKNDPHFSFSKEDGFKNGN